MLRIPRYSIIFLLDPRSFCKILPYNLSRYCICSPYCYYTCDLNILGIHIEASVSSSQNRGVTHRVEAENGWVDAMGCVEPFYHKITVSSILGLRGIVVFQSFTWVYK
jgi:hypothetical protein